MRRRPSGVSESIAGGCNSLRGGPGTEHGVMGLKITEREGERRRVTWERWAAAGSLTVHDGALGFYSKCTPVFKSDLFSLEEFAILRSVEKTVDNSHIYRVQFPCCSHLLYYTVRLSQDSVGSLNAGSVSSVPVSSCVIYCCVLIVFPSCFGPCPMSPVPPCLPCISRS